MKESFILYQSFYPPLEGLSDAEKGQILDAIFQYHAGIQVRELSPVCQMAFQFMKSQFDRNNEKYQAIVDRNRQNGKNGGRKRKNPEEPKKPSGLNGNPEEPKKPDNDNDNVNGNDKKKRKTFSPPSLQEFTKYFQDNGYPAELAERAFKGYEAADWHDSEDKQIKNWKQKCQFVWFKPENKLNGKTQLGKQNIITDW